MIWAEENGNLNLFQSEFSFGNGATGAIGIPSHSAGTLVGAMIHANGGTGTTTITVRINNVDTAVVVGLNGAGSNVTLGGSVSVSAGDVIGFFTSALTGTLTDVRVAAVIEYPLILS